MTDKFILLETALEAALAGGKAIMAIYSCEDFSVMYKEDLSPLTAADLNAHRAIKTALGKTSIPVISEEGKNIPYETRSKWKKYWLVDPLDGTKEFIKKNGEFTVNIALMEKYNDKENTFFYPSAGIIFVPAMNILYLGIEGAGAWKKEIAAGENTSIEKIMESGKKFPEKGFNKRPFTVVASRSHNTAETDEFINELEKTRGKAIRITSGSSIKLCLVAEGKADYYPRFAPTMEWDTAAGDAICRASGCSVTSWDMEKPLEYNKKDMLNPWFAAFRE